MPTVLRHERFRVMIFPNDHRPPHVHVFDADGLTIVVLNPLAVRECYGMSPRNVVRAVRLVAESRELLNAKWRKIHG